MRRPTRWSLAVAAGLILLGGCSRTPDLESEEGLREFSRSRLARLEGVVAVDGLSEPVEILRDPWGVAHIYARNPRDLFFSQGWVAAQDRLYQIEIWRRTGTGELAEVFGPDYVERDRVARLVRYRGDMEAEWRSYSPDAREIARAFTAGVNAYVAANRDRLPIEFELLDFEPGEWRPEHVLLRIAGLMMVRNVTQELARAEMITAAGLDLTREFFPTDPVRAFAPDPEVDLAGIDGRVAAGYRAAVSIPRLHVEQGSNNWVVSGRHTMTGKPLLAGDPHRAVTVPSLRYLVHLNAPGWNVIDAGEPALPGVAIGHNERIGWAFTIVQYDAADLYVERLDPDDPNRYLLGGERTAIESETTRIRVRGEAEPVEAELRYTRHGPIIWEDRENHRAVSLRWAGQEPGTAGYLGSLALDRAQDWDGFVEAMKAWKVPAENIVFADVKGDIGWVAAGLAPTRSKGAGLLPAPGHTGEYEWSGFVEVADLPRARNPEQGYLATANQNILPEAYQREVGFDWAPPYRFRRLDEVLRQGPAEGRKFSIEDFQRLQHDETSLPARELIAMLREAPEASEAVRRARGLLESWDFVLAKDSAAAALFEVWFRKLPAAYVAARVQPEFREIVTANLQTPVLLSGLGALPAAERGRLLTETLAEAASETADLLGADPAVWRWGALHKIEFQHPLADLPARRAIFNIGPFERGGDGLTPNATPGPGFTQSNGASYRQILDLADWDRSVFTSTPGQSGQPGDSHYDDLAPKWAAGEYLPLLFSREAVERAAEHRLRLEPR